MDTVLFVALPLGPAKFFAKRQIKIINDIAAHRDGSVALGVYILIIVSLSPPTSRTWLPDNVPADLFTAKVAGERKSASLVQLQPRCTAVSDWVAISAVKPDVLG